MKLPDESLRTILFVLCLFGLWFFVPLWLIGAIVFIVQMSHAPPSFYVRLSRGLLAATLVWAVLLIVVSISANTIIGVSVTIPIYVLLIGGFVAAGDMAFRSAYGPLTWDLSKMRNLRGVHLGLNLAGLFIFPVFTYLGVPLTLAKVARHRRTNRHLFGWSVTCGTFTLIVLTVVIAFAAVMAATDHDSNPGCRKRAELQITDMNLTTTSGDGISFTSAFDSTSNASSLPDFSVSATLATTTATARRCADAAPNSGSAWAAPTWMVGSAFFQQFYANKLQLLDNIIIVVVLSVLAALLHLAFIVIADQLILKNMESGQGVELGQPPSGSAPEHLQHPCASCGTMLQFVRTGPTTQVQCFQCHAIVEFSTQ